MPELPEVQTVVNTLLPAVVGATIIGVDVVRPDYIQPAGTKLANHLPGRKIVQIHRRGKRIIVSLNDGMRLLMHLGMTGRITIEPVAAARPAHTHLVISVRRGDVCSELHMRDPRRFGRVVWLGSERGEEGLGPEPLTLSARQLAALLAGSDRPIKSLLLDQKRIAGLGNIYADEALFAAGIHPLTPAGRVSVQKAAVLCRAIKQVLRKALRHRGSTLRDYVDARGGQGAFQKLHNVYDRAGKPCRKCRATIERIVLFGRSTCFCPCCQRQSGLASRQ